MTYMKNPFGKRLETANRMIAPVYMIEREITTKMPKSMVYKK